MPEIRRISSVPSHQAKIELDVTPPTDTVYYEALSAKNARLIVVYVRCDWTVQPVLNLRITADDNIMNFTLSNPASTSYYTPLLDPTLTTASLAIKGSILSEYKAFLLEARNLKIEAQTNGGTVSALYVRGYYAKW